MKSQNPLNFRMTHPKLVFLLLAKTLQSSIKNQQQHGAITNHCPYWSWSILLSSEINLLITSYHILGNI
jgi:hypothetical protein